jgi:cold shock CspA family protein
MHIIIRAFVKSSMLHSSSEALLRRLSGLNEGQIVQYDEVSNKGKMAAENLKVK